MATINSDGKIAYIYNESNDTWYALGGAVNTNAQYTWTADQTFSSPVTFNNVVKSKAGVNNFQTEADRDAAIPSPTNGIVCFIRQTSEGAIVNKIQYYYNGSWNIADDSALLSSVSAHYTIVKSDAGKTLDVSSASAVIVTIPANSTTAFSKGQKIEFLRNGAGAVSFLPDAGVTLNSKNGNRKIAAQYSGAVLTKIDTNTWLLIGDLTA